MFNEGILVLLAQEGEPHARVVLLAKNRSFVKKLLQEFADDLLDGDQIKN